jgi:hypothetical protein
MKRAREEDLLARVSALCQDAETITVDMAVDEIREFGFEVSVAQLLACCTSSGGQPRCVYGRSAHLLVPPAASSSSSRQRDYAACAPVTNRVHVFVHAGHES